MPFPDKEYCTPYKSIADLQGLDKIRFSASAIYNREAKRIFEGMLRTKQPDLIHAHNIYNGLTTSILDAARSVGIPSVLTLHDLKLSCPAYLMLSQGKPCEKCKHAHLITA